VEVWALASLTVGVISKILPAPTSPPSHDPHKTSPLSPLPSPLPPSPPPLSTTITHTWRLPGWQALAKRAICGVLSSPAAGAGCLADPGEMADPRRVR
jgi:hypothetical protein